jgi:putative hydrolase
MRDILDLHTHTIVSGHAYNTINEMVAAAQRKGLELLGVTEHAPKMPGSCNSIYFANFRVLPRKRDGLTVLYGAELNILDYEGHVDLSEEMLRELDLVIASLHIPCIQPGTKEENTRAYLKAMENPYLNIVGHPDDVRYPVEYRPIVECAKEHGILLEVNNSSLKPESFRGDPREAYREMLSLCREYQQPIVMGSDAHVDISVGVHAEAQKLLEEVGFPEELIVNTSVDKIKSYLNYFKEKR